MSTTQTTQTTDQQQVANTTSVEPTVQPQITFMSVAQFKNKTNSITLDVVKNPNTGKMFMTNGVTNWKVQADIDNTQPMSILIQDGNLTDACLVNTSADNRVFSL